MDKSFDWKSGSHKEWKDDALKSCLDWDGKFYVRCILPQEKKMKQKRKPSYLIVRSPDFRMKGGGRGVLNQTNFLFG